MRVSAALCSSLRMTRSWWPGLDRRRTGRGWGRIWLSCTSGQRIGRCYLTSISALWCILGLLTRGWRSGWGDKVLGAQKSERDLGVIMQSDLKVDKQCSKAANEANKRLGMIHRNRGGSRNLFWGGPNQGPQSKVKGEARIKGAKRPRIEGEAWTEVSPSVSPSPENFQKITLETIQFSAYLKQLLELTNEMV